MSIKATASHADREHGAQAELLDRELWENALALFASAPEHQRFTYQQISEEIELPTQMCVQLIRKMEAENLVLIARDPGIAGFTVELSINANRVIANYLAGGL